MTPLAQWTLYGFVACWFLCLFAWLHGTFYFVKWWVAGVMRRRPPLSNLKKSVPGYVAFAGFFVLGCLCGVIGQFVGGGWR